MNLLENDRYVKRLNKLIELDLPWKKLMGKTVVISGATGMIGKMLVDVLMHENINEKLNCRVVTVGRNKEKAEERFGDYLKREDFKFIEANINREQIEIDGVDFILHLASPTHPKQYATEPISTIMTNVVGLDNMLKIAVKNEESRFLFASSVEIYGENRGDVNEFDEKYLGYIDCNTLRAGYSEGKRLGEALCQAYKTQYNLDFVTVRLARVFGPTMLATDSKASSQFIMNAVKKEDIVLKSEGQQEYSFLYVADAVKGILYVLLKGKSGEVYNVADKKFNIKLRDFAMTCAEIAEKKVVFELPSEVEKRGFSKATKALMKSGKIKELGFRVNDELKKSVKETVEILRG
ncbi:NAD-dependent epimerase/dehydratase family protein [Candidatus Saccharibacteria bacterium]|nr:NAD-dependent epimerase/dehydratase family protein [Candidatus Saccharibacteria bacterium]